MVPHVFLMVGLITVLLLTYYTSSAISQLQYSLITTNHFDIFQQCHKLLDKALADFLENTHQTAEGSSFQNFISTIYMKTICWFFHSCYKAFIEGKQSLLNWSMPFLWSGKPLNMDTLLTHSKSFARYVEQSLNFILYPHGIFSTSNSVKGLVAARYRAPAKG